MKKLLSLLLILAMIFCFAACGGDEPAVDEGGQDGQQQEQQGGDEQQADGSGGENTQLPEAVDIPYDKYPWLEGIVLPDDAVITSFDDQWYGEDGIVEMIAKPVTTNQVAAYEAKLDAAGYTAAEVGGLVSPDGKFELLVDDMWVESMGYMNLVVYDVNFGNSASDSSQNEESTDGSDTAEPVASDNGTDGGEGEGLSLETFLDFYGFTEEDIMPAHFISFEPVKINDGEEPGDLRSVGYVKINVDKDATTQEDIDAWFENFYAKMQQLSSDGKLYKSFGTDEEAASVEDLKADIFWTVLPGGSWAYTCDTAKGTADLYLSASYDLEAGMYKFSITVMGML